MLLCPTGPKVTPPAMAVPPRDLSPLQMVSSSGTGIDIAEAGLTQGAQGTPAWTGWQSLTNPGTAHRPMGRTGTRSISLAPGHEPRAASQAAAWTPVPACRTGAGRAQEGNTTRAQPEPHLSLTSPTGRELLLHTQRKAELRSAQSPAKINTILLQ